MKLEQIRMFLVEGFSEPSDVDVIKKDNEVFIYSYHEEDEFYSPSSDCVFFSTKKEADEYYSEMMSKFDVEEIKKYICHLWNNDKLETILPDRVYSNFKKGYNAEMCLRYKDKNVLRKALNGILNIDASSFRLSDIDCIDYGDNWLSIVLKNGKKVIPRTETEIFIIESIFGCNDSEVYNKMIKKPI